MAKRRAQKKVASNRERVERYLKEYPKATSKEIYTKLKLKPQQVYSALNQIKKPVKVNKEAEKRIEYTENEFPTQNWRVRMSHWPNDIFILVPAKEFNIVKDVLNKLNIEMHEIED